MSMAAGEYVSVRSQADTEQAKLKLERAELKADDVGEHKIDGNLRGSRARFRARKTGAHQLMVHDAIGAHARDELGISHTLRARPIQAALTSAGCFAVGAAMPLLVTSICPATGLIPLSFWNFTGIPHPSRRVGFSRGSRTSHEQRERSASRSGVHWPWR